MMVAEFFYATQIIVQPEIFGAKPKQYAICISVIVCAFGFRIFWRILHVNYRKDTLSSLNLT